MAGNITRNAISENILARYAAGERVFADLDRADGEYDFSHADLRGAVFTYSFFFANFREANLEGADFSHCNVKTCDFSGARLVKAKFFESALCGAEFDDADMTDADFEGAGYYSHIFVKGELP